MFNLIGLGMVMGFAFAAPLGIDSAETFRRGISSGFSTTLSVQSGSPNSNATDCLLALADMAAIAQNAIMQRALGAMSVRLRF